MKFSTDMKQPVNTIIIKTKTLEGLVALSALSECSLLVLKLILADTDIFVLILLDSTMYISSMLLQTWLYD